MKVLLTGGAGFIGSHVGEKLLQRGDALTVLDNLNDAYDVGLKRENAGSLVGARVVEGDIRDHALLEGLFRQGGFDVVVHLAALAGVRASLQDPLGYIDVNVRGTQMLLDELRARPSVRMVFASSSSVYGSNETIPFREDQDVHQPVSPYAATKRAGELLCATHQHLYGNPITALRFFTVYGPRQRPEMAIHRFVADVFGGRPIPFFGDGSSRRDYTYVDDIVDGVLRAIDRPRGFRVYNLGESQTISLGDLVASIGEVTGRTPIVERKPAQPGDVPITCADVSRARAELGYEPRTPLRVGLERFVAWYAKRHGLARTPARGASAR